MSILSNLEAALEAKQEAWAAFTAYTNGADQRALLNEYDIACDRYKAILTDDTITALVAVARAADELSCIVIEKSLNLDWEYPRGMCKGCEQEALCAALEPLVKEIDHE